VKNRITHKSRAIQYYSFYHTFYKKVICSIVNNVTFVPKVTKGQGSEAPEWFCRRQKRELVRVAMEWYFAQQNRPSASLRGQW